MRKKVENTLRQTTNTLNYFKTAQKKQLEVKHNVFSIDKHLYLEPKGDHTHTMIFLHGLGDSAFGFVDIFLSPESPVNQKTKVVLLTAPEVPVTINNGMVMNSWYDIKQMNKPKADENIEDFFDLDQISENCEFIQAILEEEGKDLKDQNQLYIGGFSQGCAMALYSGLSFGQKLGGIFGLSGYLFPHTEIKQKLPIFLYHGKSDPMIPYLWAQESYKPISNLPNTQMHFEDHLEHSLSLDELQLFKKTFDQLASRQPESKL